MRGNGTDGEIESQGDYFGDERENCFGTGNEFAYVVQCGSSRLVIYSKQLCIAHVMSHWRC